MRLKMKVLLSELQEILLSRLNLELTLIAVAAILSQACSTLLWGLRLFFLFKHDDPVMCFYELQSGGSKTY